jgi:dTDP-4-amino-4,6-dideoxygalactose transaminase
VYLHPFYRERLGLRPGLCPKAEAAYGSILSLPMFPDMSDDDVSRVAETILKYTCAA